jgi:hypothetical protein
MPEETKGAEQPQSRHGRPLATLDKSGLKPWYELGLATEAFVERETLTEASIALQRYLDKGAPLGHRNEVMEFLKSRKGQ